MADLAALRAEADRTETAFEQACTEAGYGDKYAAYRADVRGEAWPEKLVAAYNAGLSAVHTFYAARDGERGFLGSRGL